MISILPTKLLHFFDICKMERDFSMRIMPKEMFSGKTEKTDRYANPETDVVTVSSLFRSVNVVLILCWRMTSFPFQ